MAVYFTLTWPLGKMFHEGIPSSNRPEDGGARYMIPGDHLQFMYQLWMLADSFTGQTPLFYHVYEFNQGDDQALYNPGSYYFPFGLLYSAGYAIGGRVVGWNLMLCVTVWLVYWATWRLLRRFSDSELTAGVAALPSILLPYFYVSLLGGSPTGLGMLWVPLIFWGVDVAIRDRKMWGGVMAGILLFIASWVDLHVFFFVFLATPVWALMCAAFSTGSLTRRSRSTRRFLPLLPILIGMIGAYLQTSIIKSSLDHTLQSQGRSIKESLGYALRWTGWFDTTLDNQYNIIYIGVWVIVILLIGLAFMGFDAWRNTPGARLRLALLVMVLASIGGIAILALGPNTPFDHEHRLWKTLRAVIQPYKMIRQPAKIYCILTPFLGIALVIVLDRFNRFIVRRVWIVLLAVLLAAGCCWDYGRRLDPTLCLLDAEQGGYRAAAEDAAKCGRENRAMAIPLWPGDSHWNSITEYYATLYRTKMLNGYSPAVSRQYFTNVFLRFEAINMGVVSDEILDGLLAMKIGYLIFHEDAFPQKVSPFPATQTLRELQQHPRLQFLANDKAVWSFKILERSPLPPCAVGTDERSPLPPCAVGTDDLQQTFLLSPSRVHPRCKVAPVLTAWQWDASDMTGASGIIQLDPRTLYPIEGLRYVASVRGRGNLSGSFGTGFSNDAFKVEVTNGTEWSWIEIPIPELPTGRQTLLAPAFTNRAGTVEVGMITLMAGPWKWLRPGETQVIPAEVFSGTGYSDPDSGCIHLEKARVQADVAFYAPVVPVLPGRYRVTLNYTAAPITPPLSHKGQGSSTLPLPLRERTEVRGLSLGDFSVLRSDGRNRVTSPVLAGQPATVEYLVDGPRPLRFELRFNRKADMVIESVALMRLE